MIFESADPNDPFSPISGVYAKPAKSRTEDDWITIGVDYRMMKDAGWTQRKFAISRKVSLSTLEKVLRRYKDKINLAYKKAKTEKRVNTLRKGEQKRQLINSFRKNLKDYGKDGAAAANNKSTKWFRDKLSKTVRSRSVVKLRPGAIYTYVYDAKHKDTLPYWDKFPLMVFLGETKTKSGQKLLLGLNLHYIPPRARQEFLEELLIHASTKRYSATTRLKIDWSMVKNMRGSKEMIKAYIPANIKGGIAEIDARDWVNVIYLPTHQFMSKGKRYSAKRVWSKY